MGEGSLRIASQCKSAVIVATMSEVESCSRLYNVRVRAIKSALTCRVTGVVEDRLVSLDFTHETLSAQLEETPDKKFDLRSGGDVVVDTGTIGLRRRRLGGTNNVKIVSIVRVFNEQINLKDPLGDERVVPRGVDVQRVETAISNLVVILGPFLVVLRDKVHENVSFVMTNKVVDSDRLPCAKAFGNRSQTIQKIPGKRLATELLSLGWPLQLLPSWLRLSQSLTNPSRRLVVLLDE